MGKGFDQYASAYDAWFLNNRNVLYSEVNLVASTLRDAGHSVIVHAGSTSFKSSMKRVDQSLAQWAVICGENEVNAGQVAIKRLRDAKGNQQFADQMTISIESLAEVFGRTKEEDFQ